jgi:hypothetical protein
MYLTIKQHKHNYKEDKTENTHAHIAKKQQTNKQIKKKTKTLHIKFIEHKLYITLNQYKKGNECCRSWVRPSVGSTLVFVASSLSTQH